MRFPKPSSMPSRSSCSPKKRRRSSIVGRPMPTPTIFTSWRGSNGSAATSGDPRRDEAIVRVCMQATKLDPGYAQAWALMALAQAELRFVHGKDENALPAADRALELNAELPE